MDFNKPLKFDAGFAKKTHHPLSPTQGGKSETGNSNTGRKIKALSVLGKGFSVASPRGLEPLLQE